MTKHIAEKLDSVSRALERQNEIAEKQNEIIQNMLNFMQKPENKVLRALGIFGLFVGALGFVNIIDTILRWFTGGGG